MTPKTYEKMTKLAADLENIAILTKGKARKIAEGLLGDEVPYIQDKLKNGDKGKENG